MKKKPAGLRIFWLLYRGQLRAHPFQELLAVVGIAAGVALLFAVQVASTSMTNSFQQLTKGIAGKATLEVAARGPQGFDQRVFRKIDRLSEVAVAAPVLERRIAVKGPSGRRPLTLVGVDERLKRLQGKLVQSIARRQDIAELGLYLTEPTAKAIGVKPGDRTAVEVGERVQRFPLAGIVQSNEIGSLAKSPVAVAHLGLAQEIAAMPERLTRVVVAPKVGREAEATAALKQVAPTLNVRSRDAEAKFLDQAAAADKQSSALFSAISLVVGILLVYNAMLLTIPSRRRAIASLNMLGASRKTIFASLTFDALILGLAGSLLGIFFGDMLSRYIFNEVPDYLSAVFAIGNQRVISLPTILLSLAGGIFASLAAAARPAAELMRLAPQEALADRAASAADIRFSFAGRGMLWAGSGLVVLFVAVALLWPKATLIAMAALILGMIMVLSTLVTYLLTLSTHLIRHTNSAVLRVSIGELASNPMRATALATVGALALFAILAITGPARDMERGLAQLQTHIYGNADVWVSPRLEENSFITQPFDHEAIARKIKRLSIVESVEVGRASFLDLGERRILAFGSSPNVKLPIAPGQIIDGDLKLATQRIRQGGWAAFTETLAKARKLKLGDRFSLPTPSGQQHFKLAATITNYVWPSGALILNANDYAAAWKTKQANALLIDLEPGASSAEAKVAVKAALGKSSPLAVQTAEESRRASVALTRQALARVNQIADMVLVAAVLAVVAAMLGSVWQRRHRLWGLVSLGMGSGHLYRVVACETGVILFIGCLIGASFGLLGQFFGGRWLHVTTAYSVPFQPAWELGLQTLVLAVVLATLAIALPVRFVFSTRNVAVSYE